MNYLGTFNYCPKVNKETVRFLEKVITQESLILETGTGNSTVWFGLRARRVVSLESKGSWYRKVNDHLKSNGIENAKIYLDRGYDSKDLGEILDEKDLIQYDIVFHDGPTPLERRIGLAEKLICRVKPGGYLVVDDTHERKRYKPALDYLDRLDWEKIVLKGEEEWGGQKESTIYRRPRI